MQRRRFLAGSLVAGLASVAGCAGRGGGGGSSDGTQTESGSTDATDGRGDTDSDTDTEATAGETPTDEPVAGDVQSVAGVSLPVPREKLSRGAGKDAIPAITDPVFGDDWAGVTIEVTNRFTGDTTEKEPRLQPDDKVVGVSRDGEARAYPLRILNWHEIVNDEFGGPLLVTFCPLCGSGLTAVRRVDGETTNFGVSGLLWNSDLVMYDELTESLWSQIAATAIRGDRVGHRLELVPSTITTLSEWRDSHPDTEILRPPPESETIVSGPGIRDYTANPYASYDESSQVGLGRNEFDDDRLHPKARVLGIAADGEAVAYPLQTVLDRGGLVEDTVGDTPVVVAVGANQQTLHGYVRRVDGTTLSFTAAGEGKMSAGGSTWSVTSGEALDGSYEGTTLDPASETGQQFWFSWADFNPETAVFGPTQGGTETPTETEPGY
ncbi:MAG: DUF3179 domain-containing protein [Halobaculum sp.]